MFELTETELKRRIRLNQKRHVRRSQARQRRRDFISEKTGLSPKDYLLQLRKEKGLPGYVTSNHEMYNLLL